MDWDWSSESVLSTPVSLQQRTIPVNSKLESREFSCLRLGIFDTHFAGEKIVLGGWT